MNLKAAIGVLMSVSGTVLAHIVIGPAPNESKILPDLLNTNQPSNNLTNNLTNTNLVLKLPQSRPETPNLLPHDQSPTKLSPGAYVSRPFTCIVIVPGVQPDNDCIIPAIIPTNSIPNAKPKLRFEPLPPTGGM